MLLSNLIAIKWKTNAALYRSTTSSSVYGSDSSLWGAHFATNGAISAIFSEIFASDYEMSPWLKVLFEDSKMITFVRVYNRRDVLGKLFKRFLIYSLHISEKFFMNQNFTLFRRQIP